MTEARRQKTEDRWQKTDGRRQRNFEFLILNLEWGMRPPARRGLGAYAPEGMGNQLILDFRFWIVERSRVE